MKTENKITIINIIFVAIVIILIVISAWVGFSIGSYNSNKYQPASTEIKVTPAIETQNITVYLDPEPLKY